MVAARHSQSITDFQEKVSETLDRLDRTGEPEILTVNGKPRAILISPEAYESLFLDTFNVQDEAMIRRSLAESEQGLARPVDEFFAEMRAELLAMKAAQDKIKRLKP